MLTTDLELPQAQDQFTQMLPEIQSRASRTFRHLNPEAKEEAVAETVAMCWMNHLHCVSRTRTGAAGWLTGIDARHTLTPL